MEKKRGGIMKSVEEFLKGCKEVPKQKTTRPLTKEEIETKKDIIKYLLNHKEIVNYTERVYNKLECILNEMLGGK